MELGEPVVCLHNPPRFGYPGGANFANGKKQTHPIPSNGNHRQGNEFLFKVWHDALGSHMVLSCWAYQPRCQVWLSFWMLPFGAMLLALVGDEMSDLAARLNRRMVESSIEVNMDSQHVLAWALGWYYMILHACFAVCFARKWWIPISLAWHFYGGCKAATYHWIIYGRHHQRIDIITMRIVALESSPLSNGRTLICIPVI